MICLMLVFSFIAKAVDIKEKAIYSTDFSKWKDASATKSESKVTVKNKYTKEAFDFILYNTEISSTNIITAKPKAHAFKNEMCFPLTKTKCELKKHPNSKFECFFNDFNRTKTSLFLPFPSKLIQDNLVCVLELQE